MATGPVRVEAVHDREETLVVELPGETEFDGSRAEPPPPGLVGVEVVPREPVDVVATGFETLQGGHPDRHSRLPNRFPDATVHSSVLGGWKRARLVMTIAGC